MNALLDALHKGKAWLNRYLDPALQPYYDRKIDRRIQKRIRSKEKVRVVFICYRPSLWGSMKTVYEAMAEDPFFEPQIITIPQEDPSVPGGYKDEGADSFFAEYHPVHGFDPETKTYYPLKNLKPDIVFYQSPYDFILEKHYRARKVCKYAKIAYIGYFAIFPDTVQRTDVLSICYQTAFFEKTSYFFAQNQGESEYVQKLLPKTIIDHLRISVTGYPKFDEMRDNHPTASDVWNYPDKTNHFRILWTPRWSTNENSCHFFAYKDKFSDYCGTHPEIDFVFRPHPQTWVEFRRTGEFTDGQRQALEAQYAQSPNMAIDNHGEYIGTFYSSDCLISDSSSMMYQYYVTGKPIIFCNHPLSCNTYDRDSAFGRSLYWAETWEEVERFLEMLKRGEDPLREERQRVIREVFQIDLQVGAGTKVKEALKKQLTR